MEIIKELINKNLKKMGYKIQRIPKTVRDIYLSKTDQINPGFFEYEAAVSFLTELKVTSERHIREGSIPEKSLRYLSNYFFKHFDHSRPLKALHIGNFVGISLTWIAHCLRQIHADSIVVSIDPNLNHRGVNYSLDVVIRLVNRYSLQKNVMCLVGYSLEKSRSNSGNEEFSSYSPSKNFDKEMSFENRLFIISK